MKTKLEVKLQKIEKELDKVRTSSFVDGWQTQRHAKKSRKWDELAKEKFKILSDIDNFDLWIKNNCQINIVDGYDYKGITYTKYKLFEVYKNL